MNQQRAPIDGETLITPELIAASADASGVAGNRESLVDAEAALALALGVTLDRLKNEGHVDQAVDYLFRTLHEMRARFSQSVWQQLVPLAQNHSVSAYLQQDPFTNWSFEKPRGYSGDAKLLDFIYGHPSVAPLVAAATPLGRAIYDYTSYAPAAVAVRERRDLLAQYVDRVASKREGGTEILAIAGGHLREGERSAALQERRLGRWVALDQDPLSVGSMVRDYAGTAVEAVNGSVKGLLGGAYRLGHFDFIYAAGLYDYLPQAAAVRLTQICLNMLKPGGLFLFANFNNDISDDGYMESFMNWPLLLRSEKDMWDIINASIDANVYEPNVFFGENRNIIYGTCHKR
ncbi:class I SAM-dependent methyltransferase [Aurantimonas aggregata]|uniref:Class I SAM-dependent methyltransferase n=1 Tax=Aurantimonas aggregata TaxID=2047720 RepID=A0A6L9MNI3_9HYPH|nr:class I SAM-dependent methyltransferase [Aurantimonas aggregata]NDV89504.1 class I SAM-dependent methyltransferase [Aurantimonas aggregata]